MGLTPAPLHHNNLTAWLEKYGQGQLNSSIFSKGPLPAITSNSIGITTPSSISYFKSYKTTVKKMLLELHNEGESDIWPNFLI